MSNQTAAQMAAVLSTLGNVGGCPPRSPRAMKAPRAGNVEALTDGTFLPLIWTGQRWDHPENDEPSQAARHNALARSLDLSRQYAADANQEERAGNRVDGRDRDDID